MRATVSRQPRPESKTSVPHCSTVARVVAGSSGSGAGGSLVQAPAGASGSPHCQTRRSLAGGYRLATGAGVQVQEVNRLLNQFEQMQKMMKQFSKGGMGKLMRGMKGMIPGMR